MYEESDHDLNADENKTIMMTAKWIEVPGCKGGGGVDFMDRHMSSVGL